MEPQFQRSFIPKKPIVAAPSASIPRTVSLLSVIATVIFILTIALAGGAFFYQGILQKTIDADQVSLDRAKGAFEPDLINQIIRLDTRIETGKQLLSSHISVTPFFNLLSQVTLPSVRFKDFSFSYLAPDKINAVLKGEAQSYASIALQSDTLSAQKPIRNLMVSDLALDPQGTVSFSMAMSVDQSLISYAAYNRSTASPASTDSAPSLQTNATNTRAQ